MRLALGKIFTALDNPKIVITEMYSNVDTTNFAIRFAGELRSATTKLADVNVLYFAKSTAFMVHTTIPLSNIIHVSNASFASGNSLMNDLRALVVPTEATVWFASDSITATDASSVKFPKISQDQTAGFGMEATVKINQAEVSKRTSGFYQSMLQRVNSTMKAGFYITTAKAHLSLTLPDMIISQTSEHILTFLGPIIDVTAQYVPPALSWGISAGVGWHNFLTGTEFKFRAGFALDTMGVGTISLTQEGVVNNPFGLPKTQLLGCTASLKVTATPPFIVGGQLVGTLVVGTNATQVGVSAIQITAGISFDPNPKSNWIYASINTLRVGDLLYHFGYNDDTKFLKLSQNLRNSGLSDVAFSLATASQTISYTDPNTKTLTNIAVDNGVMMKGKINLYGWKGAVKLVVNAAAPYLAVNITCDPITVGSLISFTLSEKETTLGPKFDFQAGKINGALAFSGDVRGHLNVANIFSTGVALIVNTEGFSASVSTSFLGVSASLSLAATWTTFHNLSFEIDASLSIGNDNTLGKTLIDSVKSANTSVVSQTTDAACAKMELNEHMGSSDSLSATVDAEFQEMIDAAHEESLLTGEDSWVIFQEKLKEWHAQRDSLVELDEDMEQTGICSSVKEWFVSTANALIPKFSAKLSFKLRLGEGWFAEVAYSASLGSKEVSGSLRIDASTLNGIKQIMEAIWTKVKDYFKEKSSALGNFFKNTLF
eukprot:TRINITY_DN303_c0_g1_i2.p2 TRINITY_DN303_c0_g1~~TRINITY_DN303_c0_g1_i2.p2  ORF type:complete len:715 (+),score=331.46 TRINITY_DN303_c0_g1_i2:61-2205(+)